MVTASLGEETKGLYDICNLVEGHNALSIPLHLHHLRPEQCLTRKQENYELPASLTKLDLTETVLKSLHFLKLAGNNVFNEADTGTAYPNFIENRQSFINTKFSTKCINQKIKPDKSPWF